ncbi:hypothetical protein DBY68_016890 [Pseudocitrobacter sp. RIT415]|uniref:hypothetical protein n=1 Tax=Pseudocitrobacter sp. RIT415 TaxID=2202163 RepID=UPI000D3C5F0A|nr:hypothetical protein [Pseudocitrobacter sp. RIT 415]RAU45291.1 hypothetical protein DBY68_016890 [Pseudocitrobacter sp. RIT 415]
MLSTTNQLNAYKELVSAGGMITPPAVNICTEAATSSAATSTLLKGLILSTVQYPATISANTTQITTWSASLSDLSKSADNHAQLLRGYTSPSALIQLSIGWDVYCRANEQEATELPVSKAITDDTHPGALRDALATLDASALKAAMDAINTSLAVGAGVSLTDAQIKALADAVAGFKTAMTAVTAAGDSLNTIYQDAVTSCNSAQTAYSNAISVALVNSSVNDSTVGSAITAITPAAVLSALKGDE